MSIIRPNPTFDVWEDPPFDDGLYRSSQIFSSIYAFQKEYLTRYDFELVRRPSAEIESQRLHCKEMMEVTSPVKKGESPLKVEEGEYSWYLQGNHVKKRLSVFEGEMVPRYRIVWGSKANPVWSGNEGAGSGTGFVDTLKPGDWICVWARAKVRSQPVSNERLTDSTPHRDPAGKITCTVSEPSLGTWSTNWLSRHRANPGCWIG